MGRHRSDPLGIARLALAGLAVVLLLALLVIGARSLFSALGSDEAAPASGPPSTSIAGSPTPAASRVPTVRIVCQADRCPVFVRVPGGDVLIDRDMTRGEQASYFDPELAVVLDDAATVAVEENGTARPAGQPGERQSFKVTRSQGR
ncbi:hypothetical protein [Microbispora sp. ATCC PTA-5024]|uniref:hypothetical protein n=1 Tax=Microbispora sp. ATCC PTA-5024 TaxID=316330 RepID=UPI0003DD6828|nr:hypothetical protein [Microbispora sp. ATCC PTA-5024]ETK34697.1 hypothetical protein MPTA5024_18180 [Microbispora sp. ATCC PTA-5024]